MIMIFCRKCLDVLCLKPVCNWCRCGSNGGATLPNNSYVHWGSTHSVLRIEERDVGILQQPPESWEQYEVALVAVPTVKSVKNLCEDPLKNI